VEGGGGTHGEAAAAGETREGAVVEVGSLEFLTLPAKEILKGEPGSDCVGQRVLARQKGLDTTYSRR
jgi:hypothetical protein